MITARPLERTVIVRVPERIDGNVATGMTFLLTVTADLRLMVRRSVDPQ